MNVSFEVYVEVIFPQFEVKFRVETIINRRLNFNRNPLGWSRVEIRAFMLFSTSFQQIYIVAEVKQRHYEHCAS